MQRWSFYTFEHAWQKNSNSERWDQQIRSCMDNSPLHCEIQLLKMYGFLFKVAIPRKSSRIRTNFKCKKLLVGYSFDCSLHPQVQFDSKNNIKLWTCWHLCYESEETQCLSNCPKLFQLVSSSDVDEIWSQNKKEKFC